MDRRGARASPIVVGELDDEHAEARYVASEINRLVEEGTSRDEIAVFYRMNAQSRVLEDTLVRFEIPYQVIGGTKFYERAEIKDAVAYLQLLANPADAISFTRIVNSPRRGIGQQTQARMLSHANTIGADVWDVLADPAQIPALGPAALKAVDAVRRDDGRPARARRARRAGRRAARGGRCTRPATSRRSRPSARSRPRAGSRTSRSWSASRASSTPTASSRVRARCTPLEEFLAQISLVSEQDDIRDEESLATLMSAAQRQGPRVRRRVRDRLRGGRLPALALARGGQPRGGAPARLRRRHPRARAPLAHLRAAGAPCTAARAGTCPRASSASSPRSWSSATSATTPTGWSLGGATPRRRATGFGERPSRRAASRRPSAKQPAPPPVSVRGRRRRRPRQLRRGRRDRGRARRRWSSSASPATAPSAS